MNKLLALGLISTLSFASLAHADSEESRMMKASRVTTAITETQLTCVRTAVSTRETSIRTAYSTLTSTLLTGLEARAKALDTAWTLTDKTARKEAREAAWATWNTTAKSAREAFKTARKTAWDTFRTSTKTCKVPSAEVESTMAQGSDVQ